MRTAVLAFAAAALLAAATPARAELVITMHDGLVSVNAKDVTLRQIMAEWAKVGQTKVVNADGIAGGPITITLVDVPEEQALATLLRSVSGYLAAPRPTVVKNASRYDRILVVPTAATPARAATAALPPAFPQPRVQAPQSNDDNDDGPPPPAPPLGGLAAPPAAGQQPRAPVFNNTSTFPPAINPQDGPNVAPPVSAPTASPTAATGTSTPGIIIAAPAPPGQQPAQR
jgi:hypothetical protein